MSPYWRKGMIGQVNKWGRETHLSNSLCRHAILEEEHSCPPPKFELPVVTSFRRRQYRKGWRSNCTVDAFDKHYLIQVKVKIRRINNVNTMCCWYECDKNDNLIMWFSSPNPKPQSNNQAKPNRRDSYKIHNQSSSELSKFLQPVTAKKSRSN